MSRPAAPRRSRIGIAAESPSAVRRYSKKGWVAMKAAVVTYLLGSFVLIGAVAVVVHSRRNDEREHCFREAEKLYATALLVQRSFDYDPDLGMFDLTGASFAEIDFRAGCPEAVETNQSAKEMLAA